MTVIFYYFVYTIIGYIFPSDLREVYSELNGKFVGILRDAIKEIVEKSLLETVKLHLLGIDSDNESRENEVERVSCRGTLMLLLRKHCFLSEFGILINLAKDLHLESSIMKLEELMKERDNLYEKILAEDFAKQAIEDHKEMKGNGKVSFLNNNFHNYSRSR